MSNTTPDIVAVIDSYSPLEHKGAIYRGYCPFCHSADDKLIVRPDIQTWHCFECGVGGDVYDFVAMYAQVSRAQAARLLAAQDDQSAQLSVEAEAPAAAADTVAAAPVASPAATEAEPAPDAEPATTEWAEPEAGPYHDYFVRLRRLKGYRLAAVLDSAHLLAVDNPAGEDPPLGELGDNLTAIARQAETLFGGETLGESYEVLFEGEQEALVFLAFQRDGQALRVLVLLQDKSQLYLARMQAAGLRKTG